MKILEKQEQKAAVVHFLAELCQSNITLLFTISTKQEGGNAHQVLGHVLLGLLLENVIISILMNVIPENELKRNSDWRCRDYIST